MKRRLITYLIAGVTFLSAFGGVASMLGTAPDLAGAESAEVQLHQNRAEQAPTAIAGGSWSGYQSDDEKKDPPGDSGNNGNSG